MNQTCRQCRAIYSLCGQTFTRYSY